MYVCVACINIQPNITVVQYSCSRQRDWLVLNPCLWQKREKNDAQKTGEQQAEAEQESEDEDFEVVESDDGRSCRRKAKVQKEGGECG